MDQTKNPIQASSAIYKVWIEDDILFAHFKGDISASIIEEILEAAKSLILKSQRPVVPFIVTFERGIKTDVSFGQLGKIIKSSLIAHVSVVCLVDVEPTGKPLLDLMNRFFLNNHMRFCKTLKEAKAIASAYRAEQDSILERDDEDDQ